MFVGAICAATVGTAFLALGGGRGAQAGASVARGCGAIRRRSQGKDEPRGGDGNDTLEGGPAKDECSGGDGKDKFVTKGQMPCEETTGDP